MIHLKFLISQENILFLDTNSSLSDYITAISCSDVVVSSDSSACHIGAALKKPTVALFGPIASSLRTHYSPTVIPIDAGYSGKKCSSPCGLSITVDPGYPSAGADHDFSGGCPEAGPDNPNSPCLLSIPFEKIADKLMECLKG